MTISLNTNIAASKAGLNLAKNQANLQKSLERLSSGKRITEASDDAGGLAVSMKLQSSISNLKADTQNIGNAITFLETRGSTLQTMNGLLLRLSELKESSNDMLLTDADKDNSYGAEYQSIAAEFLSLEAATFSGVDLFANAAAPVAYVDDNGTNVTLDQADLLSAYGANILNAVFKPDGTNPGSASELRSDVTATEIEAAIDFISSVTARNSGQISKMRVRKESIENQITGLQTALGRIVDVDIAEESSNLAKQQILVQASASMVAQANSSNNVALMLLQ